MALAQILKTVAICVRDRFTELLEVANKEGLKYVCEGSNLDDTGDYRPGLVAVAELGIKSPLKDTGFKKLFIREESKNWDLRLGINLPMPVLLQGLYMDRQ